MENKLSLCIHSFPRGFGYYELTEQEMTEKCMIYDNKLYWKIVPDKEHPVISDIWKYKVFGWDVLPESSYTYQIVKKSFDEHNTTEETPKKRKLRK